MLINGLIHARDYHRGVARILSRRINSMPEPGSIRQSLRDQQGTFRLAQTLIELDGVAIVILLVVQGLRSCLLELMRSPGGLGKIWRLAAENAASFPAGSVNIGADFFAIFFIVVGQHIRVSH